MEGSVKNQYLATICANIMALSYGAFCGWPSAAFLVLQSDESPMDKGPISNEEASWIGAIICAGGILGNFFFGWLSNKIGRKKALMFSATPMAVAFLMIPFSKSVLHLCMSRFIGGFAGGGAFAVIPIYITEIAEDRVR
uniref:Major facilitator superfamily (MFS) profile domain-containing protein n=1 Tax=Megaselia scalaris TaxID=36166 RepID=T1GYC1_MEGSC